MKLLFRQKLIMILTGALCLFFSESTATITIHILHPWADDTARVNYGLFFQYEGNWHPGAKMTKEVDDWFYITIRTPGPTSSYFSIASFKSSTYVPQDSQVKYNGGGASTGIFYRDILADMPPDSNVYIYVDDLKKPPRIVYEPPKSKVIRFFNPWEIGAPRLVLKGSKTPIRIRYMPELCGWFGYYHTRPDSLIFYFSNSRESSETFGSNGLNDKTFIDLSDQFATSDTLWILPSLTEGEPPSITPNFPGRVGNCAPITLAAILRDIGEHPDFGQSASKCINTNNDKLPVKGMVEKKLKDGKIVPTSKVCAHSADEWFTTQTITGDYKNEQCYNLTLYKNEEGLYEYDTKNFFPLDDFKFLDEAKKVPNPNYTPSKSNDSLEHNFHFTMELACEFEYVKGQTFYFRGDDDVWVFIDSQLVVDLGGLHQAASDSVDLDKLGLKEKQTYSFKLFFTERKPINSNFRVVTSINLRTSSKLFATITELGGSSKKYDMFEKVTQGQLACDQNAEVTDTIKAVVEFEIQGPSFPSPEKLFAGSKYAGITVFPDYTNITIAPDSIVQFETGIYTITYRSASDPSQSNQITFFVEKPKKPLQDDNPVIDAVISAGNNTGSADIVEVYYRDTLRKAPDSIIVAWPSLSSRKTFSGTSLTWDPANKRHVTVNVTGSFDNLLTSYAGIDSLGMSYSVDTAFANPILTSKFRIRDSIGPLILTASYMERQSDVPDTFWLSFSEELAESTLIGNSLLLIKKDTSVALTVISAVKGAANRTMVITNQLGSIVPESGDSLRFIPGGPVTDMFGIHPHDANRAVVIGIEGKPPVITSSWYKDVNADGHIDVVVMTFNKEVVPEKIKGTFSIGNMTSPIINEDRIRYPGSGSDKKQLVFDLRGYFDKEIMTTGAMTPQIEFLDFPGRQYSAQVNDSAAPVIVDALFAEGYLETNGTATPETLTITFSEPVLPCTSEQPFLFIVRPNPNELDTLRHELYTLRLNELSRANDKVVYTVLEVSGKGYPSTSDSVYINPEATIEDAARNVQNNTANRRVNLKVQPIKLRFSLSAGPSPFIPGVEKVYITVDPAVRTRNEIDIHAHAYIFDPLGTCIYDTQDRSNQTIKLEWNGTNRKGRQVGTGTYLLIVEMTDMKTAQKKVEQKKIGTRKTKL
ncbi:MAG: fibro-slime domain-containing protein [Chitinispirillaceae bacterium]|nr:fibro-slime domain-containing protein [Chitinispirillaceae bacterium]